MIPAIRRDFFVQKYNAKNFTNPSSDIIFMR